MPNEFKLSTLRQFGSENISFTATIHSDNLTLSEEELQSQVDQISTVINKAFIAVQEREISEKALLMAASERRTEEVRKLDAVLAEEMKAKKHAEETMREAERQSRKALNDAKKK